MAFVILLITIAATTGYLITYLLDPLISSANQNPENCSPPPVCKEPCSFFERFSYGFVIGLGLFTWIAYLFSLFLGLCFFAIFSAVLIMAAFSFIFTYLRRESVKIRFINEICDIKSGFLANRTFYIVGCAVFLVFAAIFWGLFSRIIMWRGGNMYTGLANNLGDLPLHLSYITSFVWGENIPPQDPIFAGEKLAYPILSDFLSAIFLKLGLNFKQALFIPGFLLSLAFYGTFYSFVYRLTKMRVAALAAQFIFFFSGGFGFFHFIKDFIDRPTGIWEFAANLSSDYTKIHTLNYHWINPLTSLNVPQRAYLFGFPITIMIFALLRSGLEVAGTKTESNRPLGASAWRFFLFAGVLAGALPFFHTHSFMAMLMVTLPMGVIFWNWRRWFLFFFPAFVLSLPQILYFSTQVDGGTFFKFHLGWMAGNENFVWFWLKNTGIFWFAVIGGFIALFVFKDFKRAGGNRRLSGYFSLTFLSLFLLPNIALFAPSEWDNIKLLIYWFLGCAPIAAYGLARLYEAKSYRIPLRIIFFTALFFLSFSGAIDVFKYAIAPNPGVFEYTGEEVALAERIVADTRPDGVFLNAPTYNHVVFLSGRKSLMGYPGHIWSHGYKDYSSRERDIKRMLKGTRDAVKLIEKYKPDYATIGRHERSLGANKIFFDKHYECIIKTGTYSIYDLTQEKQLDLNSAHIAGDKDAQQLIAQGHGLSASFYANMHWEGAPAFEQISPGISINWSNEADKQINSPFSVIWKGSIDIPEAGIYVFNLISDDGSWLYIDDELLIDNGGYHAAKSARGSVFLEKGAHNIFVKYFDAGGGAIIRLLWTPPGSDDFEEVVPLEMLRIKSL